MVEKREDDCIASPERQMMLATRIIHIYRVFYTLLYVIPDLTTEWTLFDRRHGGDFTLR